MNHRTSEDDALIREAKIRLMEHCHWSEDHACACLPQAAMHGSKTSKMKDCTKLEGDGAKPLANRKSKNCFVPPEEP
jgi:hypothetical protein